MFKVNNKDTRTSPGVFIVNFEHISHRRHYGVFIVNFKHNSHYILVFLLLTLNI